MKLLKKYGLLVFWIFVFVDVCLINISSLKAYRFYTKPILMLILLTFFYVSTRKSRHWRSKVLVFTGLITAWLADIMFLQITSNSFSDKTSVLTDDSYLFAGISLLLIGFTCYSLMFKKMSVLNIKDCQEGFLAFLAMLITGGVFYKVLPEDELIFFKPLIILGLIMMTIMMVLAANVHHNKVRRNIALQFLIPGTITLIIAMGIIVSHRFLLEKAEFLPSVIELTYCFGQMLIVRGFIKFLKA